MTTSNEHGAEIEFSRMTDAEFDDIRAEINATVKDIKLGSYDAELFRLGIAPDHVSDIDGQDFRIRKGQQLTGLEASLVLIAAREGAKIGYKVILDVWSHIVLPRLKARYGLRIKARSKDKS